MKIKNWWSRFHVFKKQIYYEQECIVHNTPNDIFHRVINFVKLGRSRQICISENFSICEIKFVIFRQNSLFIKTFLFLIASSSSVNNIWLETQEISSIERTDKLILMYLHLDNTIIELPDFLTTIKKYVITNSCTEWN